MARMHLTMKMAIYNERDGEVYHIPASGGLTVPVIGLPGYVGFADGLEIDNTMQVGDGIKTMISNETINIKRITDSYSVDIFSASRQESTVDVLLGFSLIDGQKIELSTLRIPNAKIGEFMPHAKPILSKKVKHGAASNGYELIILKFSSGDADVKYYTSLEVAYAIFMQDVSDKLRELVTP